MGKSAMHNKCGPSSD